MRAAVRTLTLNMYALGSPEVQTYLAAEPATHYFSHLGASMAESCKVLHCALESDR